MLRFLKKVFRIGEAKDSFPKPLVKESVERAVNGTDPGLRAVSGYKRKLRPAVRTALKHVNALVNGLPASVPVSPGDRGDNPLLRAFFISEDEVRDVLRNDRNLTHFLKKAATVPDKITALLVMEKIETTTLVAEMSGDAVERDIPRIMVTFEGHRLVDPSGDEGENRRLLKRRAYDHLVSLALRRITMMKTERVDMAQRHELLQAKLNILRRVGWGFEVEGSADSPDISELEEQVVQLESQLPEIGGDDRFQEAYLEILIGVLGRPGEHLWGKAETMILDSMGIRRDQLSPNARELTFLGLFNSEGRSMVVLPVVLDGAEIQDIRGGP